ncbi:MAG: aminopeptidase [Bacteroidetes bacterium]|nr:aminopeptidase [Bacteroidota bacterium]
MAIFIFSAFNYQTLIYLLYQGKGQFNILTHTESIEEFCRRAAPDIQAKLRIIQQVKKYSVDSLGYRATNNFTSVYDQKNIPVLWVLTVSEPYRLKAYEWKFPVVGTVSYKGYFKKEFAVQAGYYFKAKGYDVDVRSVSAWSTLGWFSDPILSNTLNRDKGSLCDLFFHELFHATYYAKGSVDLNENLASFIARKATLQFLSKDTLALKEYLNDYKDNLVYRQFMLRQTEWLTRKYKLIGNDPMRLVLKLKFIQQITDSLKYLKGAEETKFAARKKNMMRSQNAYFIDFEQYDSMQDSLEDVFNKIYEGNLKKMVQHLKEKAGNY